MGILTIYDLDDCCFAAEYGSEEAILKSRNLDDAKVEALFVWGLVDDGSVTIKEVR